MMRFQIYRSRFPIGRQKWRWRLIASNGRKLASSGEAFTNREDCIKSVNLIRSFAIDAVVEVGE